MSKERAPWRVPLTTLSPPPPSRGHSRQSSAASAADSTAAGAQAAAAAGGVEQQAGPAGKHQRTRKEGQTQAAKRDQPEPTAAKETNLKKGGRTEADIMITLVKAVLQTQQQSRAMASCLWVTCLVPHSWKAIKAGKDEAQQYTKAVEAKGRGHEMGPPHPHILRAFLQAVVEIPQKKPEEADPQAPAAQAMQEDTEPEWKPTLQNFIGQIDSAPSVDKVAKMVPYFRIKSAWADKSVKEEDRQAILTWCFAPDMHNSAVPEHLLAACAAAGGTEKVGPAPRGQLERLLEGWLLKKLKD